MSLCVNSAWGRFFLRKLKILSTLQGKNELPAATVGVQIFSEKDLTYARRFYASDQLLVAEGKLAVNKIPGWNKAVSEAEKIVEYAASFLNLRCLLGDEIANVALDMRKLVGTNHPLLKTAKSLLSNGANNMQALGLIVLLISKAAGHLIVDEMEEGVLHSQRVLAQVTEMIRTCHLMHKGLVNIYPDQYTEQAVMNDMTYGNKIALLSGDYFLANALKKLALLRNNELCELMSMAVRDFADGEFHGRRDNQNNPLPQAEPVVNVIEDWTKRNVLSTGSLLGKGCLGTLKLAGHDEELQDQGYKFGEHLALAWQACLDVEPFLPCSNYIAGKMFELTSAPVMFHLEHDPSLFEEIDKGAESVQLVDYAKVFSTVSNGPGVELTKRLQKEHSQQAMEVLEVFQDSDARTALMNIIVAIGEL